MRVALRIAGYGLQVARFGVRGGALCALGNELKLSSTPFRITRNKISFIDYEDEGEFNKTELLNTKRVPRTVHLVTRNAYRASRM
jgi:hypothetical protein